MNTANGADGPLDASTCMSDDDVLWHHPAFCQLALPLRSGKDPWARHAGGGSVVLEPILPDTAVPSGRFLRIILLRICNAAVRARDPLVEIGDDAAAWFAALGLELSANELRDLSRQLGRVAGSRLEVSVAGAPVLPVFDARSRPRGRDTTWGSSVRLNGRFLASLLEGAVPLGRDAIRTLWRVPEAFDAYAWAVHEAHRADGDAVPVTWDELRRRFGLSSRGAEAFRASFEEALRTAASAAPLIGIVLGEEHVEIRRAAVRMPDQTSHKGAARHDAAFGQRARSSPVEAPDAVMNTAPGNSETGTPSPDVSPAERENPPGLAAAVDQPAISDLPDPVSLPARQTGVPGVIWLRHGHGEAFPLVAITPGGRLDPARLTVLAVEPMVLQVEGGLPERDFGQVAAWITANRDLIDDVWEGRIGSVEELDARVQVLRAPTWR